MKKLLVFTLALSLFSGSCSAKGSTTHKEQNMQNLKVAVLAASGKAGSLIVEEAVGRGLKVSAFVRDSKKGKFAKEVEVVQKDIFKLESKDLQGFDVIIDAFGEWQNLSLHKKHIEHLAQILKGSQAKLLIVGGAGSLYMDTSHTTRLYDTKEFPSEYLPLAKAQGEVLDFLRGVGDIHWVFVSPPAIFVYDAPKTGKYKIIGEVFEVNDKGESKGSYADYASALLDIALDSKYDRQRVGVIGL